MAADILGLAIGRGRPLGRPMAGDILGSDIGRGKPLGRPMAGGILGSAIARGRPFGQPMAEDILGPAIGRGRPLGRPMAEGILGPAIGRGRPFGRPMAGVSRRDMIDAASPSFGRDRGWDGNISPPSLSPGATRVVNSRYSVIADPSERFSLHPSEVRSYYFFIRLSCLPFSPRHTRPFSGVDIPGSLTLSSFLSLRKRFNIPGSISILRSLPDDL